MTYSLGLNILYVSSFVPRKCGIATFCRDLASGVEAANPTINTNIMAMVDKTSADLKYPPQVQFVIPQEDWSQYQKVLQIINQDRSFDVVCIQHEFGIFGGKDGEMIIPFIKQIKKPVVTTLHTITPNPTPNQKRIIKVLCEYSSKVVVMLQAGADILADTYQIDTSNISVISHGVPSFSNLNTSQLKKELAWDDKVVMTGVNLLSPDKGVEYGIRSLPYIIKEIPNFVYQVIGVTHPVFVKYLGGTDTFRQNLIKIAKDLKVSKHVNFINEYVPVEDLVKYVAASDYYLTPYLDPQQITSGALAYAIGAGKVCISTPYIYAREMLGNGRGVLVEFKDSEAIAKAIIRINANPQEKQRREKRTYRIGKEMTWTVVGDQYQKIFMGLCYPPTPSINYPSVTLNG